MEKTIRGMRKSSIAMGGLLILLSVGLIIQVNKGIEANEKIQSLSNSLVNLTEQRDEEIQVYKSIIELKDSELSEASNSIETLTQQGKKLTEELNKFKNENTELNKKVKELSSKTTYDTSNTSNNNNNNNSSEWLTFTMTHYTADCKGCTGKTATGVDVRNTTTHQGRRVISVDPNQIPLGSIVQINEDGNVYEAQALDTGSAIKGRKIDMLVGSTSTAYEKGVKSIKIKVIREGW